MATQPESDQSRQIDVDMTKVFASYQRQVSDQSHQIAVLEAMNETLQEERAEMRQIIDSLSAQIPQDKPMPAPTKRTTPRKKK